MASRALDSVQPGHDDVAAAEMALEQVKKYLARHPEGPEQVRLRVENGGDGELVVPRGAVELFALILAHMAAGEGVSVVPSHAELTTQQAAEVLNVSRPFLIGLLEAGEIEYRMVGTHRRVMMASLLRYRREDDLRRRAKADELAALRQEMGLE
jgi:excisionase family DNA binding protein